VVLAGETRVRPTTVSIAAAGMASHLLLDAEMRDRIYDTQLIDIARVLRAAFRKPTASRYADLGFSTFPKLTTSADAYSRWARIGC